MERIQTALLRLRGNRFLEYAEYGDPHGTPMFYFHGYFGSCYQAALVDDFAKRKGIRIIATNRPGIGRSSPSHSKRMTDYAKDIEQLADALGIDSFAIIGASGGGCFALACAQVLPHRVKLAGVFGGIGPLNVMNNLQQMTGFRKVFLSACHNHRHVVTWFLKVVFLVCKKWPFLSYDLLLRTSILEPELRYRKDIQQMLWLDYKNVFLQKNGVQGLLLEATLYFNWGFDLRDFPADKLVLYWHGQNDTIVTWKDMQKIMQPVAHAEAIICPGGHLTYLLKKVDYVMLRMKQESDAQEKVFRKGTRSSFLALQS